MIVDNQILQSVMVREEQVTKTLKNEELWDLFQIEISLILAKDWSIVMIITCDHTRHTKIFI